MSRWDWGEVNHCPGCASDDLEYVFATEEHRCRACGKAWRIDLADEVTAAPDGGRGR